MTEGETETIAGRFATYRVLEVTPSFSDRDGASRTYLGPANSDGCRIELTLGDVPDAFVRGLSYAVPVVAGFPAAQAAGAHANVPEPERDGEPYDLSRPDFIDPKQTYLTVACIRESTAEALKGRRVFWVADCDRMLSELRRFSDTAENALDLACARLLTSNVQVTQVVHATRRLFEPADDAWQPVAPSRLTGSATVTVTRPGWDAHDMATVTGVADNLWKAGRNDHVVATPAWWYYQAMQERDPLRRFLFAHWGLESLASKFCS